MHSQARLVSPRCTNKNISADGNSTGKQRCFESILAGTRYFKEMPN